MHMGDSEWRASALCSACLGLMLLVALAAVATAKVVIDGAQSHAVAVQVRIARYRWLIGNTGAAASELAEAGALIGPAGLRRQAADALFLVSASEAWFGRVDQARVVCRSALAVLGFGRYDRAYAGTSTAAARCAEDAAIEAVAATKQSSLNTQAAACTGRGRVSGPGRPSLTPTVPQSPLEK